MTEHPSPTDPDHTLTLHDAQWVQVGPVRADTFVTYHRGTLRLGGVTTALSPRWLNGHAAWREDGGLLAIGLFIGAPEVGPPGQSLMLVDVGSRRFAVVTAGSTVVPLRFQDGEIIYRKGPVEYGMRVHPEKDWRPLADISGRHALDPSR
ncbi:MAG: hypothetical protein ACI8S6_001282 [Myxococcota bacterium]|jgi:hypothetical protein